VLSLAKEINVQVSRNVFCFVSVQMNNAKKNGETNTPVQTVEIFGISWLKIAV
jgi:hypothetical protein